MVCYLVICWLLSRYDYFLKSMQSDVKTLTYKWTSLSNLDWKQVSQNRINQSSVKSLRIDDNFEAPLCLNILMMNKSKLHYRNPDQNIEKNVRI